MQLVLMGYMGSGKTTVGKYLAKKLKIQFIDLDQYISSKEKLSINAIFSSRGEIYFRKLENKYLKELLLSDEAFILSLGGGTPCYANNIEIIKNESNSLYLKSSISTLYNRLSKSKDKRPLIKKIKNTDLREFIAKHLFERNVYYEKADLTITIDDKEVKDIVDEIMLSIQQLPFC